MLKIRLQRIGRINQPAYRLVVIEHARSPKAGNFVEQVGTYNPKTKERTLKEDRIRYWLGTGAQASGTVHNMLISAGVITGKKVNVLPKKTVEKKEEEKPEAKEAAHTEEKAEEPVAAPEAAPTEPSVEETPEAAEPEAVEAEAAAA